MRRARRKPVPGAVRTAEWRAREAEREAAGLIELRVRVDETAAADVLVAAGVLPPTSECRRRDLELATERLFHVLGRKV